MLCHLIPQLFLGALLGCHNKFDACCVACEEFDAVVVEHLVSHHIFRTVGTKGGDAQLLRALVVDDGEGGVGLQGIFLNEGLVFLVGGFLLGCT